MATTDVILNLVAKLDQGNIQSQAETMASSMAKAIEQAFEGLGNRIAQSILAGVQGGVRGGMEFLTTGRNDSNQNAEETVRRLVAQGATLINNVPQPPQGPSGPVGYAAPQFGGGDANFQFSTSYGGGTGAPMGQFQGGFNRPRNPTGDSLQSLRDSDPIVQQARVLVAARGSGVGIDLDSDTKNKFSEKRDDLRESLRALFGRAEELPDELAKLRERIGALMPVVESQTEAQRKTSDEAKQLSQMRTQEQMLEKEQRQVGPQAQASQAAIGSLNQALATGSGVSAFAGPLQALGAGMGFAGQIPGALRGSQAASSEINNLETRSLMRGDIERIIATERLGGQDAVKGRAQGEEAMTSIGQIVGGLGLAIGTGGIGSIAGMGIAGRGAMNLMNFNKNVQSNMEGQIGAEQTNSSELMQFTRAGRETAVGSFRTAQGLGAPELSGMIAGGLDGNRIQQEMQQQRDQLRELETRRDFMQMNTPGDPALGGINRQISAYQSSIGGLGAQAGAASPYQVVGAGGQTMSIRDLATASNLSPDQMQSTMTSLSSRMGGSFLDRGRPELMNNMQGVADLMRAQGAGLSNAPEIANGLFQGGATRGDALEGTRQMFEDAVAAGLDKAEAGRALSGMAARAAASGIGGAGAARIEMEQNLGFAQRMGSMEGPQAGFAMGTMDFMRNTSRSDSGIGAVAGLKNAQGFGQKYGLKLDFADELRLAQLQNDPEGMASFLKSKGRDDLAGNAENMSKEFNAGAVESTQSMTEGLLGKRGSDYSLGRARGVSTLTQGVEFDRQMAAIRGGGAGGDADGRALQFDENGAPYMGVRTREETDPITGKSTLQPMSPLESMERSASKATGAPEARALAEVDSKKIAEGLNNLGSTLPLLNTALANLITRANEVLSRPIQTTTPGSAFDFGANSSKLKAPGSFLNANAPKGG